ncbi:MAG: hypothetical protein J1E95_08635 [Muribaculaceae bacterium]|nr:hypothetical protein [Muribaculaceae bacterium]
MEFIGKIFESLEEDYRNVLISIVVAFPICFIDLWKLFPDFREYEFLPQLMLPLGGAVLFTGLGIFVYIINITIIDPSLEIAKYMKFNPAVILMPLFFPSAILFGGFINSLNLFKFSIVTACAGILVGAFIVKFPLKGKGRPGKKRGDKSEEYECK